jgi:membrane-bound metal-dependent hydrolase YbcI (DUF457 family)
MMGVSHATSGALVGLAVAQVAPAWVTGAHEPVDALTFAALVAGYSMLSDLDHESSTVTKRFGVASWLASSVVRPLSAAVFRATATAKDRARGKGTHRYLTHTAVFAVSLGVAVNVLVAMAGTWALWSVVFVGVALAVKGIDHLIPGPPSLLAAAGITAGLYWVTGTGTAWAGTAVALGILVHCAGDAVTLSGCPVAWPLEIRGQRWYPLGPPVRFRTGGVVESGLLVLMTGAVIWLAVETVPAVAELRDVVWAAVT